MTRTKILLTENSRTLLTVSEKMENKPKKFPQFLATTLATLSALTAGMCLSWSSPALPMLKQPGAPLNISEQQGAWVASLLTLGACVGAIPTGTIANSIGRKRTLQILALPVFISWLMIAFGGCVYALYAARFLAGLAVGAISVAAPMYVAELAHISIRGTLGTFFQVLITTGLLVEYILGGTIVNFKFLALTSAILPVVFLVSFSFMPETPVYLYTKGRVQEARRSLAFLWGSSYNLDDELTKIADKVKQATTNKTRPLDLITCKATRRGLTVSIGLMVFQQLSGINAVLFYANYIFHETGSSMSSDACAVIVGVVMVVATLLSTLLIDKSGRKILLFLSASVMSVCLVTLGVYFHLKQTRDLAYLSVLPLVSLTVFIVMFSIGFGPVPWIMLGEIFTPNSKGIASSISAAVNWILAFTVTNQFPNMKDSLGIGITFVIFGIICVIATIFVGFIVPETKGKDIEQVQNILRNIGTTCSNRRAGRTSIQEEVCC